MIHTFRYRLLSLALICAALTISVRVASADTFNFSGTLAFPINNSTTVTGQFTIDFTTDSITAFAFTTPIGNFDSPSDIGQVSELSATNPNAKFTNLLFLDSTGADLVLLFESPLNAFDGSGFYTDAITVPGGGTDSRLDLIQGGVPFSDGSARPVTSAVPEPGSTLLLMSCVAFLYLIARRKMRRISTAD